MTLPAFRYRDRAEERKKPSELGPPYIWTFDIDDTVTAAPQRFVRLAEALKAQGDHIVCVTGHGPVETREHLLEALGFPYDEIIIVDPGEDGSGKAKALKHLGAFMHFDNEVAFGPEIIKVCPVAFQYVDPPGDSHPKHDAKAAAKALKK
jgi:hydroxymethylpyrimidine pyrophosphatase-like HAD family hydrolase